MIVEIAERGNTTTGLLQKTQENYLQMLYEGVQYRVRVQLLSVWEVEVSRPNTRHVPYLVEYYGYTAVGLPVKYILPLPAVYDEEKPIPGKK